MFFFFRHCDAFPRFPLNDLEAILPTRTLPPALSTVALAPFFPVSSEEVAALPRLGAGGVAAAALGAASSSEDSLELSNPRRRRLVTLRAPGEASVGAPEVDGSAEAASMVVVTGADVVGGTLAVTGLA